MQALILRILFVILVLYVLHLIAKRKNVGRSIGKSPEVTEHVGYDKKEWEEIKKQLNKE